ncbi:protein ECERIFERUM 26-like [Nicotiana tomentosiformis]|uniref:protein ECERIFERUM 26-like n=1 Tax=Nicotiana tomentosiformis TaxID=4098 RepID=UPI00051C00B7|nr:protein ECERIFERUM 26-like [Nicotiana tomentosiformis]
MVSSKSEAGLIYNIKFSSVGPANVTGQDVVYEPSNIDLAMKLHYLRGIYYFNSQAFQDVTIYKVKEPIFSWFSHFYMTAGRFRRAESGRPYIKCNDCGARFIEAQCDKTLEEWLEMKDASLEKLLVSNQVLGPELTFSPPILIQHTKFKCGGIALGLSWAHVLGDVFSATEFINFLGKVVGGFQPARPNNLAHLLTKANPTQTLQKIVEDPLSIKRVGPVEDHWIANNSCKMESFSFYITASKLGHLQSRTEIQGPFESLCAIIWQSISRIRDGPEPKVVTICKKSEEKKEGPVGNNQFIGVVKVDHSIREANPSELARLIKNEIIDERLKIDEAIEKDHGVSDVVVYGANLTFVNVEGADLYGFDWEGHKPTNVSYLVDGVGDAGAVVVLPAGPNDSSKDGDEGRVVTMTLPEDEIMKLKYELNKEWSIA